MCCSDWCHPIRAVAACRAASGSWHAHSIRTTTGSSKQHGGRSGGVGAGSAPLGVVSDLPAAAVAICCGQDWVLQLRLYSLAADTLDLLQLAVNCSRAATAFSAFPLLIRPQLDPEFVRRLFITAAVRQHASLFSLLEALPAVRQHINAATFCPVMKMLMVSNRLSHVAFLLVARMWLEPQLPAVQQPTVQNVVELLQAALDTAVDGMLYHLCRLPAAQQLASGDVMQLLEAAVERGKDKMVPHLCSLPAAQQLTCNDVKQLLQAAVERRKYDTVRHLNRLPAALQLATGDAMQLLRAPAGERNYYREAEVFSTGWQGW